MSTTALVWVPQATTPPEPVDPRLIQLKQMVLDAVTSTNSKRNYAKALDDLFVFAAGRPLTRALLMEWRAATDKLSFNRQCASFGVCKLVVGKTA